MTIWEIQQNPKFPHRYAVKKHSGTITNRAGELVYLPAGTVMIDDRLPSEKAVFPFEIDGTIFTPEEWEFFVKSGFDINIYNSKRIFDCDIILDNKVT